jgi:cell division protein FtsI/penicillin-binding protein 2
MVKKMMIAVVVRGTGTTAALPGVTVAGKTGTATNPHGAAHSWFVCFAPASHPRVAVAIVVENAGYGALVAAPIARDVMRTALNVIKD